MSITQAHVAIITVTYNCSDFVEDYLTAITPFLQQSSHQLILVDNDSSDNTCEIIRRFIDEHSLTNNITLIASDDNLGFGKGCNLGATTAQPLNPTHLWFLNPDTRVFEDSGAQLLSLFKHNSQVDFAGSVLVNEHMESRAGAFRFPSLTNVCLSSLKLGILDKLLPKFTTAAPIEKTPYTADWLTGASFMVKAKCFYALDGFDPFYFLYFEEVDLFYRAKQKDFSVWACPDSKVFHMSGASTGINQQNNNPQIQHKRQPSYWFESRRHYYTSNYGKLYFAAVDATFIICHLLWKLRSKLQNKADDTPAFFVRDILSHGYPKQWFTRKK